MRNMVRGNGRKIMHEQQEVNPALVKKRFSMLGECWGVGQKSGPHKKDINTTVMASLVLVVIVVLRSVSSRAMNKTFQFNMADLK